MPNKFIYNSLNLLLILFSLAMHTDYRFFNFTCTCSTNIFSTHFKNIQRSMHLALFLFTVRSMTSIDSHRVRIRKRGAFRRHLYISKRLNLIQK